MIKLTLGNSVSKIEALSVQQYKALREILSYEEPKEKTFFSPFRRSFRKYLIGTRGDFPSGLTYLVRNFLKALPHTLIDSRIKPQDNSEALFILGSIPNPHPWQLDACKAAVEARRGTISAVTAAGKTLAMALIINKLQLKTLIIVPNLGLKKQAEASFRHYFGSLDNITIENIDSSNLETLTDFDVLIIDEAHHVAAKTYRRLNVKCWNKIFYRFFFSGTPFRSKSEEQMLMESISGKIIYEINYKTAAAKGYISKVEAYYIEIPKTNTEGYTWNEVYSDLVVNHDERNDKIRNLLYDLGAAGKPTICLVKEIAHGDNLIRGTELDFMNGQDIRSSYALEWFNLGQIKVLIGTQGILGEGVDSRAAEYIIVAGLGKAKGQFCQAIGRGLRKYPGKDTAKIIIFKDKSHKFTINHFNAQVKILKEVYGIKPVRLYV